MPLKLTITAEKPTLSSFRERWIKTQLAQVEAKLALKEDELQYGLRTRELSPAKIDQSQFELDALRDLKANLYNGLETVARQNYAVLADPEEDDDLPQRIGGWKTRRAYLENLQRERDKISPLSRDQYDLAKELSAKRSKRGRPVDLSSEDILRAEHPTWYTDNNRARSYMYAKETLTGVDPCLDAKRTRRQVMFAQKTAGIGYRVRHEWKPC